MLREKDYDTKGPGSTLDCDLPPFKIETLSIIGQKFFNVLKMAASVNGREICGGEESCATTRERAAKPRGSLACPFTCHSRVSSCLQEVCVKLCTFHCWLVTNMPTHLFVPQLFDLEERRKQGMHRLAVLIQTIFRGWRQQKQVC